MLGFGMGNLKDSTLEKLADHGNGNYAYIDTLSEARKVLVEQIGGTLVTIAKDVKLQVEFNPATVKAFRLIGYENRVLAHQDFNDDKKDAGDIGAGHTVTALYEVVPAGGSLEVPGVDPLKYQEAPRPKREANRRASSSRVKLRYKQPDGDKSTLLEETLADRNVAFEEASHRLPLRVLGRVLRHAAARLAFQGRCEVRERHSLGPRQSLGTRQGQPEGRVRDARREGPPPAAKAAAVDVGPPSSSSLGPYGYRRPLRGRSGSPSTLDGLNLWRTETRRFGFSSRGGEYEGLGREVPIHRSDPGDGQQPRRRGR